MKLVVSKDILLEKNSLNDLRQQFEKFYSVTDEKFDLKEFEKVVPEEFRLKTKGKGLLKVIGFAVTVRQG